MAKRPRLKRTSAQTVGRERLIAYLEGTSQTELARKLGLGQPAVARWVQGGSRPDPHYRVALERIAGIPADAWYSTEELAIASGKPSRRTRTGTDD